MQPFAGVRPEGISTRKPFAVAEQCHEAVGLGIRACVRRSLGHLGQAGRGTELGFQRANGCRLRVRENDARDGLVVGFPSLAENVRSNDARLIFPNVSELPDAVAIADGPQTLARAQAFINRNSTLAGFDADSVQPNPLDARTPSGSDEQPIAIHLPSIIQLYGVDLTLLTHGARMHAERDLDTVTTQCFGECFAERLRLAGEQVRVAFNEHHITAEPTNGLRHLDADWSASEHDQPTRNSLHCCRFAAGPDPLEAAEPGHWWNDRLRTRCENNVLCVVTSAIDLDRASSREPRASANQVDAMVRKPAFLAGVRVV